MSVCHRFETCSITVYLGLQNVNPLQISKIWVGKGGMNWREPTIPSDRVLCTPQNGAVSKPYLSRFKTPRLSVTGQADFKDHVLEQIVVTKYVRAVSSPKARSLQLPSTRSAKLLLPFSLPTTSYNTSVRIISFAPCPTPDPSWSKDPRASPCGKTTTDPILGATG